MKPPMPASRGPLSEFLCARLRGAPGSISGWVTPSDSAINGEDFQLALHLCYGLHYDGFSGVDESWEWEPSLLELRRYLEDRFLSALVAEACLRDSGPGLPLGCADTIPRVRSLVGADGGPSLSRFMADRGTKDALREFVIHRSIYQCKEADPHTWAIPRLRGRAKSALVELQADEYGRGVLGQSHAELFAATMTALDLDPSPGAYIDRVPGVTLATDNLVSFLGLHRRWRGALVGHLAAFEMTSVIPMSRYATAIRRILKDEVAAEFYDAHVVADVRHEQIVTDDLIAGLVETDPVGSVMSASGWLPCSPWRDGSPTICWNVGHTDIVRSLARSTHSGVRSPHSLHRHIPRTNPLISPALSVISLRSRATPFLPSAWCTSRTSARVNAAARSDPTPRRQRHGPRSRVR